MFKKWTMIIGLLIPLMGCNSLAFLQGKTNQPMIPIKIETLFHTPGDFARIDVRGELILNIHTGARSAWFSMHGDSRDLRNIEWKVKPKSKTLRIRLDGRFPKHGPVTIDIGARQLDAILYHGNGGVTGRRLYSKQLDVEINNSKNTVTLLEGRMNLRHVSLSGDGKIQLNGGGNNSMDLTIRGKVHAKITGTTTPKKIDMAGSSYLNLPQVRAKNMQLTMTRDSNAQMAGTAQWALIKMDGNAHFNGRSLRITEAFVRTDDYAMALIYVTSTQHALASGQSNIYYYNVPTYQNDFMAKNGTILNLGAEKSSKKSNKKQ